MIKFRSSVSEIRRKVFTEIAKTAFGEGDVRAELEAIPYRITPTEQPQYRESIYRERAIAAERVRLAMGMSLNPQDRSVPLTEGLDRSDIAEVYYEPPLMQVIPSACNKCESNAYVVSDQCCKCVSRYCVHACPTQAVFVREDGFASIDRKKCIRCGKCKAACPYEAIVHKTRPCAEHCGVDAISDDTYGRAWIDPQKCVACGQCMIHCPFGAIADKSQIFQLIRALRQGDRIAAEVAPAVAGQFGAKVTVGQLASALRALGLDAVYEVARGADIGAMEDAKIYAEEVAAGKRPFLLTSCCPSWMMLAKHDFRGVAMGASATLTPMVTTARAIKRARPDVKVVFIGPCSAKKLEAMRHSVRSDVDFVLTFEETAAILEARGIDIEKMGEGEIEEATAAGRGYGAAGGVVQAITACVDQYFPGTEMKAEHAEGLFECRKLLQLAKFGKREGYLLEGMGCPGGCVGGSGVNITVGQGTAALARYVASTPQKVPKNTV